MPAETGSDFCRHHIRDEHLQRAWFRVLVPGFERIGEDYESERVAREAALLEEEEKARQGRQAANAAERAALPRRKARRSRRAP